MERVTLGTSKRSQCAKVALKQCVPKGVTFSVSIKLNQTGAGYTVFGAAAEPLLSQNTPEYFFESWNSCKTHIGLYKSMNTGYNSVPSMDLRDLNVGLSDNGYMCRDTLGYARDRFENGDVMTMQINLTEPLPKECSTMATTLNQENHFIAGTQRGTGFIRYFKNNEQIGPTLYNIYMNDPLNPYSVIVILNMMLGLTADLVDVRTHESKNAYQLPRTLN
jgi:hypothetical protein